MIEKSGENCLAQQNKFIFIRLLFLFLILNITSFQILFSCEQQLFPDFSVSYGCFSDDEEDENEWLRSENQRLRNELDFAYQKEQSLIFQLKQKNKEATFWQQGAIRDRAKNVLFQHELERFKEREVKLNALVVDRGDLRVHESVFLDALEKRLLQAEQAFKKAKDENDSLKLKLNTVMKSSEHKDRMMQTLGERLQRVERENRSLLYIKDRLAENNMHLLKESRALKQQDRASASKLDDVSRQAGVLITAPSHLGSH